MSVRANNGAQAQKPQAQAQKPQAQAQKPQAQAQKPQAQAQKPQKKASKKKRKKKMRKKDVLARPAADQRVRFLVNQPKGSATEGIEQPKESVAAAAHTRALASY